MGFYEQISKYYDYIFPVGTAQMQFIKDSSGEAGSSVLDVACGSGGYTVGLAKAGYRVTGVDLDEAMVAKAREKIESEGVHAEATRCNMLELTEKLSGEYDCIFCIGNSIVHLGGMPDIVRALEQMHHLLDSKGKLVLQIINYDRIMKYSVNDLPSLKDDSVGLEFTRRYEYDEAAGVINFKTVLTVENPEGRETYLNSIPLFPLLSKDMAKMLEEAGFKRLQYYGDFDCSPYDENSFMLVVRAEK